MNNPNQLNFNLLNFKLQLSQQLILMRSSQLMLTNSSTLPSGGSHSPVAAVRNDYNSAMHRSIARYLKSQADRTMFRDNCLIDPHKQSLKETQERYVSPYNRAVLGDISKPNQIPELKLNIQQTTMADHEKRIARVDKNVLNVQTRKDALDYFAKKFENKAKEKFSKLVMNASQNNSMTRRNTINNQHQFIMSTCVAQAAVQSKMTSRSRSREKSCGARKQDQQVVVTKIRQKSIDHHEKLSKQAAAELTNRSTFLRFINQGDSQNQVRQKNHALPHKGTSITSQSLNLLPALTDSRRESKAERKIIGSCLGALGKLTSKSKENSREHSRECEDKLSKKISQHSFEDIYLHSSGQYFEAPPKIKRKQICNYDLSSNENFNEFQQASKLFPIITNSVSNIESRNFEQSGVLGIQEVDEQDIVQFEDGRITPPQQCKGLKQTQTMSLSQKKSDRKQLTSLVDVQKSDQLVPFDRYGSVIAKNMMKLQRRYREELNPSSKNKNLPVAHSMKVFQPAKKLRKSPKLEKVDLVADIESAYGKAFGTDVSPYEKNMADLQHDGVISTISISQDLTNVGAAATTSLYSHTTAPSTSLVKRKKKNSEVLAQIKNQLNKKSKKVNKLTRQLSKENPSFISKQRPERKFSEIMLHKCHQ